MLTCYQINKIENFELLTLEILLLSKRIYWFPTCNKITVPTQNG